VGDRHLFDAVTVNRGVVSARDVGTAVANTLDSTGIIERGRLDETVDLAWPRILTGFAIMSKRTVDLAVVGVAVGAEAVAGLTVANGFWMVAKFLFIGLAGGTLSLVSQNVGGDRLDRAQSVVATSLVASVGLAVVLVPILVLTAAPLIAPFSSGPEVTRLGALYLIWVAPGLLFEGVNLVASRTYAGAGDTVTPMAVRATGAVLNIALTAGLVFGGGLGVVGAALGTTLSTALVAGVFAWGLTGRSYWGRGASQIPMGPDVSFDATLGRQLLSVSTPLVARRAAQGLVVFPLLAVAAGFGPVVLAALGVARQVRALLNSFTWGFSIAASTLAGQALGAAEEAKAALYGREIAQLSLLLYALSAVVVVALATPVAAVFVDGAAVGPTATFVRVAAVSAVPLGIDGSVTGLLRGAGDTRVPFVATLVGLYVFAVPAAYLGTVTALGMGGLLLALLFETVVPMVVNVARFRQGTWKSVSRAYRPEAGD
jgi:putative MATE family efflux protein